MTALFIEDIIGVFCNYFQNNLTFASFTDIYREKKDK